MTRIRTRTTRARSDRGATLVEFAFVVPLLLLLAFGTAEMGLAWVANNRAEGSASTAARIGASSGAVDEADLSMLQSLRSSLPQEQLERLDRVVIYNAQSADGEVPAACVKAVGSSDQVGVNGVCNTYAGSTLQPAIIVIGAADQFWDPEDRHDSLSDPPDYLGVWIRTTYESKTGTFFDDMTITKSSVYRIQPDIDG